MSNVINKILIYVGGIAVLLAFGFVIFKQNQITQQQQQISASIIEQKTLLDNIVRGKGSYATSEEVEKFLKSHGFNTQYIKDDLKKLDAKVNSGSVVVVNSGTGNVPKTDIPSSSQGPEENKPTQDQLKCPMCDPFGYLARQQNLDLVEKFDNTNVPFGQIGFSSWKEKPWSLNVFQRQYKVLTVVGVDENERSYYYNKFSLTVDGKEYDLKIATSENKQVSPSASMHWFNPHLFIGAGAGYNFSNTSANANASLSLGISSYGRFKTTPDLSLFQLGIGYDAATKRPQVSIAPINVNIGNLIGTRLISNTYIGPAFNVNIPNGNMSATMQLSIGF